MRWEINKKKPANEPLTRETLIDLLLLNRGVETKKDKESFLSPDLKTVTIESVGLDKKHVSKALKRIEKAIASKEQIIVFGDYDVDGITGSAILWEVLFGMGANVMPYIPHRIDEGYGLSKIGIENVQKKFENIKLIITVDNGIVANDAVDFANSLGIDVIITDHHLPHDDKEHKLPNAFAIVHTTKLCGAGVAYLLSKHIDKSQVDDIHLELAALGTVADMVPLVGANRIIVFDGLKRICETKREGLLALFEEAGVDHTVGISPHHVGFMIAPRLNASGRLESAMDSLRLLCTKDKKRAKDLAFSLGQVNRERQILMKESSLHAIELFNQKTKLNNLLIAVSEKYQEGVIGLVAGKLVEAYYRPAIVIAKREKHSKASVRSVKGFNIIEFLRSHSDLFVNVGGHPMAAGFTVETEKIDILVQRLEESARNFIKKELLERTITIDSELDFSLITEHSYRAIQQLSPFGIGNPEPVFLTNDVKIDDLRAIGKEGKHLKMKLKNKGKMFDAIGFGMGVKEKEIKMGDTINIVFSIDENVWNGRTTLQLKLKDFIATS